MPRTDDLRWHRAIRPRPAAATSMAVVRGLLTAGDGPSARLSAISQVTRACWARFVRGPLPHEQGQRGKLVVRRGLRGRNDEIGGTFMVKPICGACCPRRGDVGRRNGSSASATRWTGAARAAAPVFPVSPATFCRMSPPLSTRMPLPRVVAEHDVEGPGIINTPEGSRRMLPRHGPR